MSDTTNNDNTFLPPAAVGKPFRGDPKQPFPFSVQGQPEISDSAAAPPLASNSPVRPVSVPPPLPAQAGGTHSEPRFLPLPPEFTQAKSRQANANSDQRYAKIALGVAIGSLIVFGVVLGPVGMLMGMRAVQRGEKKMGWWAVGIGLFGLVSGIVLIALIANGQLEGFNELVQNAKKNGS